MISVIIVAFNEERLIESIINELRNQLFHGDYEIILADGGSIDNTVAIAAKNNIKVVTCRKGKSKQINDSVKEAKGDILFFVHADMQLSNQTFSSIKKQIDKEYDGGGFLNAFDKHNAKIKKLGIWMNFRIFNKGEQPDKGIFYGDNGIFVKRKVFNELGGFKEISIMEDYDFSFRMKTNYNVILIKEPKIIVSARRHVKAGFLKTRFQWVMIRKLYLLGVAPERLAKWYKDIR